MSDTGPMLDYAPPARRRVFSRKLLAWLGVVVLLLAGVEFLPGWVARGRGLWLERRCARFEWPADAVVYTDDPALAGKVALDGENYVKLGGGADWPAGAVGRREPQCWTDLKRSMFGNRTFWPPGPATPKALVHRLVTSRGQEYLVAIIVAPDRDGVAKGGIGLVSATVSEGDWERPANWRGNGEFLSQPFAGGKRITFYAAKLDASDRSRFTIDYQMDGVAGVVEGRLGDGGQVTLSVKPR